VNRLVEWQLRRPFAALAVAAAITAVFAVLASGLTLRTRYDALLPDSSPSVQELRRLEQRTTAAQTLLVVLEGDDRPALRRMADEVVPALVALGPTEISSAEDGPHEVRSFLGPRVGLLFDTGELRRLDADVQARWDYEVMKEGGFSINDDEPAPPLDWKGIEKRLRETSGSSANRDVERFPDGYYERTEGRALVVVARSPVPGGDLKRARVVVNHARQVVEGVRSHTREYAGISVSYAGDLPTGFREYTVVLHDLLDVGATGIALILAAVLLYFLRISALLVMGVTIAVGLIWTFGVTRLVIGHLNAATAFTVSIVAGNGINVGILYQARYFEERRRGLDAASAIRTAVRETWKPTAVAALSSAAAYGSLTITDFRAFRDFGFIAATGMLLCWVVKTLMVPPLLLLLDRSRVRRASGWLARNEMAYGRLFARLAPMAPTAVVAAGALLLALGAAAAVRFVRNDPMEYDLRRTETDRSQTADLHHAWDVARDVLGSSQGALVIATEGPSDAAALLEALRARWRDAPAGDKPFVAVHGLADLVSPDQEGKLDLLLSIGDRLERAHARGFVTEDDWAKVRDVLPPHDLHAYTAVDVPASIADRFTDTNGVRGALVYIESDPATADDLRSLVRYADAFRATTLRDGKVVRGSGSAVILADMLRAVVRDVPRALTLSIVLTLFSVFIAFRRGPYLAAVLFAWGVGCGGVLCFIAGAGVKLNFLNFVALPITFGIGVDYAVNVAQRYEADGGRGALEALRTSGGAVVLCSLTTMLGYLALLGSHNAAIRSLGTIAAVGELSCLLAAVLVMPALWVLLERRPGRAWRAAACPAPAVAEENDVVILGSQLSASLPAGGRPKGQVV
jgi:predicted RND superfamily exporter protein